MFRSFWFDRRKHFISFIFDSLFDLVGQINQSDPLQVYLKESEKIFKARLIQESLDLDNLYSLAISQILQKNPEAAISTIGIINNLDPVAITLFSFEIKWYSLSYIIGIILGWLYCKKKIVDNNISKNFDDLI